MEMKNFMVRAGLLASEVLILIAIVIFFYFAFYLGPAMDIETTGKIIITALLMFLLGWIGGIRKERRRQVRIQREGKGGTGHG